MKNLKRVLSLGLASVMLLGMMVVGASAKDFTDAEDIVHTEAVETMVALKVINGKEDGSYFDPKGSVTRGEMAKMIAVLMNGGSEANTGVKSTPSFTDIGGHWAEGWIEYCADMKIINGRGDGTFDPNGLVTGVEALKMVLTAMGYDAEAYHLQGAAWASQTLERARQTNPVKLVEELDDVKMTEPASRDVAAQMIWNGLQAYVVTNSPSQNTNNGEVTWDWKEGTTTLLKQRYDANVATGTYQGNYYYNGNGALKGEINVNLTLGDYTKGSVKFPSDMSIDNIGEEVKVVWKDSNKGIAGPDKEDTIFGVFNTGATRVVRSQLSKIKDQKTKKAQINIDGTLYDVTDASVANESNVTVVVNYAQSYTNKSAVDGTTLEEATPNSKGEKEAANSSLTKLLKKNSGNPFKAVFDDNGKISTIYVTETFLATVTGNNATTISINNNVGNLKYEDNDIEEGLKRGDVVAVTLLYDNNYRGSKALTTVTKAEKVSGELTAFKSDDGKKEDESVTVSGKTYKINYKNLDSGKLFSNISSKASLLQDIPEEDGDIVKNFYQAIRDNTYIGEDFDLYLVNGYVLAAVQTSEAAKNYSVITEVKNTSTAGGTFGALQLQVMGADGTKEIITVSKDSKVYDKDAKKSLTHDTGRTNSDNIDQDDYYVGDIITYTFDSDDNAEVTIRGLVGTDSMTYDEKSKTVSFKGGSIPTAGDCLFFANTHNDTYNKLKMPNAEWEVYDIRDLDEIKTADHDKNVTVALNSDGDRVVAVFANMKDTPDGAADDTVYGIVSSYNGRVKDYYTYTIQANGEEYEVNYKGTNSTALKKGELVKFRPTADNNYKETAIEKVDTLVNSDGESVWFTGYASELKDDVLVFYVDGEVVNNGGVYEVNKVGGTKVKSHSYALDKDCKVVYIDQDADKSEAEGSVTEFSSVTGSKNIGFVTKETTNDQGTKRTVITALFFETSNNINVDGSKIK